mmetsp:Transcript_7394/g.18811  ORF Transcript_7394/g.18811 Transcript_7394/m.18811 type:complete len:1283 (+) Transcript_7394:321-4169(+)
MIRTPPRITWELPSIQGTACPPGRSGHTTTGGLIDGELVLFGGGGDGTYFNDLWRIMSCTGLDGGLEWCKLEAEGIEPEPRAYHTAVAVGRRMFIFGGWKGDEFINDLNILEAQQGDTADDDGQSDSVRFTWTTPEVLGDAPGPRAYHTAVELEGKLVVFGGWGAQDFCSDVAVLSVAQGEQPAWESTSLFEQAPKARAAHSCTRIGELLYVFGGESSDGRLNDVAILDVNARQWSFPKIGGTPPSPRSGHVAAAVGDQLVVIFGGWDGDRHLTDLHLLDTSGMRWVSTRPPVPKDSESASNTLEGRSGYASALVAGDKLIITGGWDRENFLADIVVLDTSELTKGEWSGRVNNSGVKDEMPEVYILPQGSPAWLESIVSDMEPRDRVRVEALLEWRTFVSQAPKIVDGVDGSLKEETMEFMRSTASLLIAAAIHKANNERLTWATRASSSVTHGVKSFGSSLALRAATNLCAGVKSWSQPYAKLLSPVTDGVNQPVHTDSGEATSLLQVAQGSIKERALLGGASLLKTLLRRELAAARARSDALASLACSVIVQPLFQSYAELKRVQHAIRHCDPQNLAQQLASREALHQTCSQLALTLTQKLREMVLQQRYRTDHARIVSTELEEALGSSDASQSDVQRGISNFSSLPEFLSDADAFASIDEALQDWDGWEAQNKAASHVFRATDEALVQLSSALSEELVVLDDLPAGTVQAGQRKAHSIVRAAQRFIGHLTFGASVYDSELHQTESLLADCSSVSTELGTLDASRKEAQEVQLELMNVMAAHLKSSEAVIRNHAESELLRLHGTSGNDDIKDVEEKLACARKSVAELAGRQAQLEARLASFAQGCMPELLFSADPRLAKRLMYTGLVVERRLGDYEQLEVLHGARHHVLLVKFNNRVVVLKEIALNNEAARKVFENEVSLLWKLRHPAIIKVEAIFYEGLRAYIQMPYVDQGTLRQWLLSNPKPWEVQSVFRQLVQGLAYMHDHGIVHRDIKMDNVLMTADTRPVICDFGISHETSRNYSDSGGTMSTESTRERTNTGGGYTPAGTEGYIAPEVLMGKRATPAADMWAIGILLCKAYFGSEPVVSPNGTIAVPDRHPGEPIQDLVDGLLKMSPEERITANEALAMPFFAASLQRQLILSKELLESDSKIDLLRRQVRLLQDGRLAFALHVRRKHIVLDAIQALASMKSDSLIQPMRVHYIGEAGLDGGGLSYDFYAIFFDNILDNRCVRTLFISRKYCNNDVAAPLLQIGMFFSKAERASSSYRALDVWILTLSGSWAE